MKKKMMVTALSSMFVVGTLGACGGGGEDTENQPATENGGNTTNTTEDTGNDAESNSMGGTENDPVEE